MQGSDAEVLPSRSLILAERVEHVRGKPDLGGAWPRWPTVEKDLCHSPEMILLGLIAFGESRFPLPSLDASPTGLLQGSQPTKTFLVLFSAQELLSPRVPTLTLQVSVLASSLQRDHRPKTRPSPEALRL